MAKVIIKLDGGDIYELLRNEGDLVKHVDKKELEIHVNNLPVWASDGLEEAKQRIPILGTAPGLISEVNEDCLPEVACPMCDGGGLVKSWTKGGSTGHPERLSPCPECEDEPRQSENYVVVPKDHKCGE